MSAYYKADTDEIRRPVINIINFWDLTWIWSAIWLDKSEIAFLSFLFFSFLYVQIMLTEAIACFYLLLGLLSKPFSSVDFGSCAALCTKILKHSTEEWKFSPQSVRSPSSAPSAVMLKETVLLTSVISLKHTTLCTVFICFSASPITVRSKVLQNNKATLNVCALVDQASIFHPDWMNDSPYVSVVSYNVAMSHSIPCLIVYFSLSKTTIY